MLQGLSVCGSGSCERVISGATWFLVVAGDDGRRAVVVHGSRVYGR